MNIEIKKEFINDIKTDANNCPKDIIINVLSYLKKEDGAYTSLINKSFYEATLSYFPFRNLVHFILASHRLEDSTGPCLIRYKEKKSRPNLTEDNHLYFNLHELRQLMKLTQAIKEPYEELSKTFLLKNKNLFPELTLQISQAPALVNLCELLLKDFNSEEKSLINTNPLLNIALFNTEYKGSSIIEFLMIDKEWHKKQFDWSSRVEVFMGILRDYYKLKNVDDEFKKDREVVLLALKRGGFSSDALEYADDSLKKNKEIVLTAVKISGTAIKFAHEELKKDKEIVLEALKNDIDASKYIDKSLLSDQYLMLEVLKSNCYALEFLTPQYKKDKQLVLSLVKRNGLILNYADDCLKKDKELVLAAVKQDLDAFQFADACLKKDREFILFLLKSINSYSCGTILYYLHESLKVDAEIVLTILNKNFNEAQFMNSVLWKDKKFVIELIRINNAQQCPVTIEPSLQEWLKKHHNI